MFLKMIHKSDLTITKLFLNMSFITLKLLAFISKEEDLLNIKNIILTIAMIF